MNLDTKDLDILSRLQKDSTITHKQLSEHLGLSTTAVYERVKKLERLGIIKKYAAILDRKAMGMELLVISHVKLVRHSQSNIEEFESQILQLSEVLECFHVSGDYDYVLKMTFKNMEDYRDFMITKITALQSIGSTHSIFVINEVKNDVGYRI